MIFIGDPGVNLRTVQDMNGLVRKMEASLEQKIKLGELSKGEKAANLHRYADQIFGNFVRASSVR